MASVEIMKAVAIDSSLRFGMTDGGGKRVGGRQWERKC